MGEGRVAAVIKLFLKNKSFYILPVAGDKNCPVSGGTLYAYPEGDTYEFKYTFDSLIKTNIDLIDRWACVCVHTGQSAMSSAVHSTCSLVQLMSYC